MNSHFSISFSHFVDADDNDMAANAATLDTDGWTRDAIVKLCEINIPLLSTYNSGSINIKRRHWKNVAEEMGKLGFVSETYNSSKKVSKKWRYLFTQYKKVKDNNGKTGRGRVKFRYYDDMHKIFIAHNVESVVINPDFLQPGDDAEISVRKRGAKKPKEDHNKLMREMQQNYNDETLQLQRQALDLEREKINLLKELLAKKQSF